jgi:hypothetical protein
VLECRSWGGISPTNFDGLRSLHIEPAEAWDASPRFPVEMWADGYLGAAGCEPRHLRVTVDRRCVSTRCELPQRRFHRAAIHEIVEDSVADGFGVR